MALTQHKKRDLVADYTDGLAAAPHAFLVNFGQITVPQATELRSKIRETGGHYQVVKNSLALRAVDGKGLAALSDQFEGPTAVAYTSDDAVSLAKALTVFKKTVPLFEFKGGVVDGQPVAADEVEQIATMPSREELIAKLLFLLQSPVTRFVRTLAAIPRGFVIVLDQIAKQREEAG